MERRTGRWRVDPRSRSCGQTHPLRRTFTSRAGRSGRTEMGSPFSVGPIESGGGGGGVSGLASADGGTALADNAIVRGDGTTGIQGSGLLLDDTAQILPSSASGGSAWLSGIRFNRLVDQLPPSSDANNPQVSISTGASGA